MPHGSTVSQFWQEWNVDFFAWNLKIAYIDVQETNGKFLLKKKLG